MNNDEVEKNIIEAIELLGKTIYASHKILEDRISNIVNLLTIQENEKKPEPTATNHRGNNTVGPGIITEKEEPISSKIPLSYKIAEKGCKYCDGIVAWPRKFVTDKEVAEGKVRGGPIHCDIDGNIIGVGRCPNL